MKKIILAFAIFVFISIIIGISLFSHQAGEIVKDIEGNVYKTVVIGKQTWMAENLIVTKDPDGHPITSYCYNDDPGNCEKYGRLYTWDVAMNGSTQEKASGICPNGWHLPSDEEWTILFNYLGGEEIAGKELKVGGSSGFEAFLGGSADFRGKYLYLGEYGLFWSSTQTSKERAFHHHVAKDGTSGRFAAMKGARISIRCIKD